MAFEVKVSQGKAGDRSGDVYELTDGTVRAEVWPMWGFNCIKWQVKRGDAWADIMFHMPDWEANPVPTRSGQPILFPFPGRLRDGRMSLDGKTYQLPLTDSTKQHAIHGFTPRNPWRVTDHNYCDETECASLTGEFQLSKDLPESAALWPDFVLNITYRLYPNKLRVDARVTNPGSGRLPFGLGYHGYFCLPGADADIGTSVLKANVAEIYESENNFPTGKTSAPPAELDFQKPKPLGATALDNAFGKVTGAEGGGLREIATLSHPKASGTLRVLADASFRELVLFTPVHRKAIAIEPYTCSADASNLAARGVDSGWRVLEPGGEWKGTVEYIFEC